jgi:peptidoglycan hydrolase-like protein with peptidoglycan-binding domain
MRVGVLGIVSVGLMLTARGSTETQRAATGGLTGIGVGAVVCGPIGAVVGGVVGAAGGAAAPEGADQAAKNVLHKEKAASGSSQPPGVSRRQVRQAQTELEREGLYHGEIDGIVGAGTRRALDAYQQREGLPQTATLDQATLSHAAPTAPPPSDTAPPSPSAAPPNDAPSPPQSR